MRSEDFEVVADKEYEAFLICPDHRRRGHDPRCSSDAIPAKGYRLGVLLEQATAHIAEVHPESAGQ